MIELLLPIFGFLIGTVASMIGIGGGVFIVPLLALLYGFSPAQAVGTSLTTIIFTSLASTANYSKQKRIYYKIGLILAITTIPGAILGAYLTSIIQQPLLGLTFGVFLIFVALRMIFRLNLSKTQSIISSEHTMLENKKKVWLGLALSFFGGLSSGLLGIGGGALLVPIMNLAMGMTMHVTTATSMFTMIFTSTSGVVQHLSLGHVNLESALLLAVGTIFGAQLGAYGSKKISGGNLRRIFGLVLIIISIRMILKYA